ncbi:MAG: serine/threonine-protein kinase [Chloroflexota bacterium]|nr:serine/threonine-protein kinase [Chloroflexota bacterium]
MSEARVISGRYKVEGLINKGGMGAVYRGIDEQSGETVAIKTLDNYVLKEDTTLLDRFRREAELLRKLAHPFIVKIFDTVDEADAHHIIMEYMAGGSVKQMIAQENKLAVDWSVQTGIDLSDALARAHRLQVIHRDLKPSNVLLTEQRSPRLSDFGVARSGDHQTRLTMQGALLGSIAYLAPEVCKGGEYSEKSDIWSFGMVMYEMLAGQHPFKAARPALVVDGILNAPTPELERFRGDVPPALSELIMRMLAKDPEDRIDSARAVGTALEQIARQFTPIVVSPPPPVPDPAPAAPPPPPTDVMLPKPKAPTGTMPVPSVTKAMTETRVFVCYRREDTGTAVEALVLRLNPVIGRDRIFRDIDRLSAQASSRLLLTHEILSNCTHLLLVIGRKGINTPENALQDPNDPVRVQLETAFKRPSLQVIPLLVDNAAMPDAASLPASLRPLETLTPQILGSGPMFEVAIARLVVQLQAQPIRALSMRWLPLVIGVLVVLVIVIILLLQRGA